ncbi:MAG: tRNA uridine-5-carboxymethylaminomethyl(34) synthesis GTPase MnmE [Bdellovibrionales bacterium]|nr:tRNA uridine-5-carboxymethylaminomethyl(34) synthesis GTPase MnmE [Bdellovibrionales bacterium]
MFSFKRDEDTICAIISASGTGGISVVRVSGPQSVDISRKVFPTLPEVLETHKVYYGYAHLLSSGEPFDEVLTTYFQKNRSFTCEETVEISCHGGVQISKLLLNQLLLAGARIAEPGEFTYRAFMNGRIDLVQAESVLSLIQSKSQKASQLALRQLKGELSRELQGIEDELIWVQAHFEANIDFSEEDIEVSDKSVLREKLLAATEEVSRLLSSFKSGRVVTDGLRVSIVGSPNVGKSSLLNQLLGEDRAIVTDIPGTTRDIVEGVTSYNGNLVTFVDTAGLRTSDDIVEQIGMDRAKKALLSSDMILFVLDLTQKVDWEWIPELDSFDRESVLILFNKADLAENVTNMHQNPGFFDAYLEQTSSFWSEKLTLFPRKHLIPLSVKSGVGVENVQNLIKEKVLSLTNEESSVLIQNRHFELLKKIAASINKTISVLNNDESPEFLAFELQEAIIALHEILGKKFDDQVMDRVFKEFCLGK